MDAHHAITGKSMWDFTNEADMKLAGAVGLSRDGTKVFVATQVHL